MRDLPHDVLALIIDAVPASDTPTLAALLRTSRVAYTLAAPRLYAELLITDTNMPSVLHGLMSPAASSSAAEDELGHDLVRQDPSTFQSDHSDSSRNSSNTLPPTHSPAGSHSQVDNPADNPADSPSNRSSTGDDQYPTPQSNARKRHLLSLTRTLCVSSVPSAAAQFSGCPLNPALFPQLRTVQVLAQVPHHAAIGREGRGPGVV